MTRAIDRFQPDIGIEYVDQLPQAQSSMSLEALPDPTSGRVRDRLDELYPRDELERNLQAFVTPRVADPSILRPARFESLLTEALDALKSHSQRNDSPETEALASLLNREILLRQQLASMRMALISA